MKLATLHDGSRDGQLVVVSRDLSTAHFAADIAGTLQQVLDDWNFLSPQLEDLYATLNGGKARHAFAFDPQRCLAPLPRAHLWVAGGRLARSDAFLRPTGPVPAGLQGLQPWWQWVAMTGDLPARHADGDATDAADASVLDSVRLLALALTWLRPPPTAADSADSAAHAAASLGSPVAATAFAPVVATPDELGPAWTGAHSAAAWAEPVSLRRQGRLQAAPATAAAEPAGPGLGLLTALAPLLRAAAGEPGATVGSLVGSGPLPAGPAWAAGDRIELQAQGLDGHSLVGSLRLQADAPDTPDGAGVP